MIRVTFPFDSFNITYSKNRSEVYIHLPEDCPLAGQFFSVSKNCTNSKGDALEVILPKDALIYLFSDPEKMFNAVKWRTLFMQVDTYLLEKGGNKA